MPRSMGIALRESIERKSFIDGRRLRTFTLAPLALVVGGERFREVGPPTLGNPSSINIRQYMSYKMHVEASVSPAAHPCSYISPIASCF